MIRTGLGFDVHAFASGRKLILGGVSIPFEKGLAGHSDADVLTHAVIDAMLGAAALGDIGSHFPSSGSEYKNINSLILLEKTCVTVRAHGFEIVNIDSTVVLQSPEIREYISGMRNNLAMVLNINIENVSVKATTTDLLGFTGRGEGVAAFAVATLSQLKG